MEEHRLKPMQAGYNVEVFNRIYKNVNPLKRKLASQISASRFGLTYDDMLSWFDIKILHVYNKHCMEFPENRLQAYIINSLKVYKNRILKVAYQKKYAEPLLKNVDDIYKYQNRQDVPDTMAAKEHYLNHIENYFLNHLSPEAYLIFQIDLNPPPYIQEQIKIANKRRGKIPASIIGDYLELEGPDVEPLIESLRKEIQSTFKRAKVELPALTEPFDN